MDYRALGKNIKRERRSQNLTQEQLAELVNISTVFLSVSYTHLPSPRDA